ncbi:MAG TPA: CDP-glycerol glycerophosphotransferase family protein [Candidatus Acidoferrales bacterium]|nr:CDP-glycerol glycerophosphotransferase family protein [Candidatus Acidoferrales bacterium]
MSRGLRRLALTLVRVGFAIGRRTPIRGRVVLATSQADTLGGNLGAIRAGLAGRSPGIPVTVLARRRAGTAGWRAGLDLVLAGWHLATARLFVVDDHYLPMYAIRPRSGTARVQVWHACGAFKKFGYSLADKAFGADAATLEAFPIHTNYDRCLVSAMRFAPFYAEAFRQPVERFTSHYGIPRTDLFFDAPRAAAIAADVRRRYAIPEGRRVILYAPTFRGELTTQARSPEGLDLAALRAVLGADHVLLVRAHPFVRDRLRIGGAAEGFAIDVSDHPDINELMLASDVLVTDYSSAIYEFALLGRPIAFLAPDHAAYERERGFYLDFAADLPGPVFEETAELAAFLRGGAFDLEAVARFRAESFDVADGHATERFIDELVRPVLAGAPLP